MKSQWCRPVAMDLGVYQLRHFSISFLSSLLGTENASLRLDNSSSGASVVAIDNKIEQAMPESQQVCQNTHVLYPGRSRAHWLSGSHFHVLPDSGVLQDSSSMISGGTHDVLGFTAPSLQEFQTFEIRGLGSLLAPRCTRSGFTASVKQSSQWFASPALSSSVVTAKPHSDRVLAPFLAFLVRLAGNF
ncbi:TSC22 domain family member 1 [Phyllostomus discolor]|uniref:TSC22 domain family member 1 n=1 Tax=Phyllostomus discolor TaxID=89673 RepID=A0A834DPB7_9CHIR|nr:TSC22 domain family member 1 [Phyllostomus discolor]